MPSRRKDLDAAVCKEKSCVAIDVKIVALSFETVMKSVGDGHADVAISSITYIPDREPKYNLLFGGQSYETTGFGLVSRSPDPTHPAVAAQALPFLGGKVAVQDETTSYYCMKWLQDKLQGSGGPAPFDIVKLDRNVFALNELAHGTAGFGFVVVDQPFAEGWQKREGQGRVQVDPLVPVFAAQKDERTPQFCLGQQYRLAVRAGEYNLQRVADKVVEHLIATGDLERLKVEAKKRLDDQLLDASKDAGTAPAAANGQFVR